MKLLNLTNNKVIATNVIMADTFCKRLMGLMGRSNLPLDTAMVLKPCKQVHTYFMRFPILVMFINDEGRVICVERLVPNKISRYIKDSEIVIEMSWVNNKSDTILVKEGDEISI